MTTLKSLKNEYLEYIEIERNRAEKTIENYNRYLERFVKFAHIEDIDNLSEEKIRQYRLYLNRIKDRDGQSLKKVTQNYHIIALRNFLKYCAKRGIKTVPAERIELGRQEERQVAFLEHQELARLLVAPKGDSILVLRDRALLATLFSTGMRVSEIHKMDRDKIDIKGGEVSVRGKGGKTRLVFLSDDTKKHLKDYLAKRVDVDEALFIRIPRSGTFKKDDDLRLTPRSIQRIVGKYATLAGIVGKHVSPHTLRHSHATDLLRNGADIRSVQTMLGHSSVTTTQIYTHVTDQQLREVHKKYHNKEQ